MNVVGVIPARYLSQRLPGKVLLPIAAKPMIYWVYQKALQADLDAVYVATDHAQIFQAVEDFGGKAILTKSEHTSGTERVSEVAERIAARFFVNIQGDEPLIAPEVIRAVADTVCSGVSPVVSAMVQLHDPEGYRDPTVVKVVANRQGRALYFSRLPIPYYLDTNRGPYFKHLGIYGYTREFLTSLRCLSDSRLEQAEKLEQLRFLENGVSIHMVQVEHDSVGVDTAEDLERVRRLFESPTSWKVQSEIADHKYQPKARLR
ncbi:MAG: 3-deoxy-manno-octulosonate cytidylyltransferase [Acidobacteria bacterium]|nr:3-deoxy-manno-octulosonate cytidylyltransferase [Acidobacteriota bacterium]